jgi:nucleoside-diphosphate-sugar epimerase
MLSLVTGSSGLLGGCLVSRLEQRGAPLRLLDLEPPSDDHPAAAGRHEFIRDDMSDEARIAEAVRGCDVVYHLAAAQRMKPQFTAWSEAEIYRRNLDGLRFILRAAERGDVSKVVFTSSSGVYGVPQRLPVDEDHPTRPLGAYGFSKLEAEALCHEAVERGLDVTILRPMSLFGPRMSGIFVILFEWIRRGRPVFMLGSGANRVQASSAWDVADACIAAADSPRSKGGVFNVAADPPGVPTVLEEVRALIEHAGTGSRVVRIPALLLRNAARALNLVRLSPIVPEHYILADKNFMTDIQAAKDVLAWEPQYDNTRMLIEAYDWYLGAGPAYRPVSHPILRLLDWITPVHKAAS